MSDIEIKKLESIETALAKQLIEMFVGAEKDNFPARQLYASTGGEADEDSVWFNYYF